MRLEGQGLRARLCCRKISDSIFWLHCFTPRWLAGAMPCPKKVPKELYKKKKKRLKQIRDEDVSFILSFIYWVQQTFHELGSFSWIHWNRWIPQLRCQKHVYRFHVCRCQHLVFRASIRICFLLEVCQSPVRVSLDVGVVPRHDSNDVIRTLVTAWKRKIIWSPLSRGMPFFFTQTSSLFAVRDLWEFLQI